MTLAASGLTFWPTPYVGGGTLATALSAGTITYDSDTDRIAYVGRAWFTDSISVIYFRTGTVTTGCTVNVNVETVTNGRPSGTLWNSPTNTTTASVVIADGDDNVWKTATLTDAASLAPGDEFAITITVDTAGATPNLQFSTLAGAISTGVFRPMYPFCLQDTGAGTYAVSNELFAWVIELSSAGVVPFPSLSPQSGNGTLTAFNSGSSPDEYAASFQIPFKARCVGIRAFLANMAAGADFTVSLWPSSSTTDGDALAQTVEDGDVAPSTTADGYYDMFFDAAVTLSPATQYYAGIRADTANSLSFVTITTDSGISNSMKAMLSQTTSFFQATRTWAAGSAGAWTTSATNTYPMISLILDQLDDGAGGGGGSQRVIGG